LCVTGVPLFGFPVLVFGDPVDQHGETDHEPGGSDQRHRDDVEGTQLAQVLLVRTFLAHAEESPQHRLGGPQDAHPGTLPPVRAACGAAGTLAPTSKKVYDSVMVVTSFDSFGSITNATGHCFFSPGASVYWLKQKHSILLKCGPAWRGA